LGLGFVAGDVTMGHVFAPLWPCLPDPGRQPSEPLFGYSVFEM